MRRLSPALLLLLSACSSLNPWGAPSPKDVLERFPTPIYAITGEPLNGGALGNPKCNDAQALWFESVDTDHNGAIELDELLAHGKRQFQAMDVFHTGTLTADGLAIFRAPFALDNRRHDTPEQAAIDDPAANNKHKKDPTADRPMAARPLSSQPDPVLAADSNLDFQVTWDEYAQALRDTFTQLDKNRDHRLSLDNLAIPCQWRERAAVRSR